MTTEIPVIAEALGADLRTGRAELARETLLWQRWMRYLAAATMVLLTVLLGSAGRAALLPMAGVAAVYSGLVMAVAFVLLRRPQVKPGVWVASLILAADVAVLSGFCYLTSAPLELHRILLLGFILTQVGAFYFGRREATLVALLTVGAYLALALAAPPFVPGARPGMMSAALDAALFAGLSTALVYALGGLRARIDSLRMHCKIIETGESLTVPAIGIDRWPDELTLLARDFRSMHARLAEQVGSDALTGCLNRRSFETRLRGDLRHARRRGSTVAVIAVDVDKFKEINDSYGHGVGDIVLRQVAEIMKTEARDTDAVARYGGDEFVIVLPDTGWQGALTFADRLRRCVDDHSFGPADTPPVDVTISVGVALARGTESLSTEVLLREADAALYRAKTAGRNRVFS